MEEKDIIEKFSDYKMLINDIMRSIAQLKMTTKKHEELINRTINAVNVLQKTVSPGVQQVVSHKYPESNNVEAWLNELASFFAITKDGLIATLQILDKISPAAFLSLVINGVARVIDSCYDSNIKKEQTIYIIGKSNGKIYSLNSTDIKCYKYFAAFRTQEEAVCALKLWQNMKRYILNEQHK